MMSLEMSVPGVQEIVVERVDDCIICGKLGHALYENLKDRLYGVSGRYGFYQCDQCDFVWLNPRPTPKSLGLCYPNYKPHQSQPLSSTPAAGRPFQATRATVRRVVLAADKGYPADDCSATMRALGKVLASLPLLRRMASYGHDELVPSFAPGGRLLEVGCGKGAYLALMHRLGWKVTGVDFSSQAAAAARELYGVDVLVGRLQETGLPPTSFDVISMIHTIEHINDLPDFLAECRRILKPGGRLICTTPNLYSLGHRIFRRNWMALDPPRHLSMFSPDTLRRVVEQAGFKILKLSSRANMARDNFDLSLHIRGQGRADQGLSLVGGTRRGYAFELFEKALLFACRWLGEELMLVGTLLP